MECLPSPAQSVELCTGDGLFSEIGFLAFQFLAQGFGLSVGEAVQQSPEAGAVVHFAGVGEFVQQDVVYQVVGEQEEEAGEVDGGTGGTAAPTAATAGDADALEGKVVVEGELAEARRKHGTGMTVQALLDGLPEPGLLRCGGEVGVGGTDDDEGLFRLFAEQEAGMVSGGKMQVEVGCVKTEGEVYGWTSGLLTGGEQAGTELFYGPLHFADRSAGRYADMDGIVAGTESEPAGTGMDADKETAQLGVFDDVFCGRMGRKGHTDSEFCGDKRTKFFGHKQSFVSAFGVS